MLILALESSAKAASAALCRDGELIAHSFQCSGLTHSRTLLPMAEDLLKNTDTALRCVDAVAVACGPGSFTGIRIGVAAVKGLCWGGDIPAVGVSTLEAMAWNGVAAPADAVICCVMDARRGQFYNALFRMENGAPKRLSADRAIAPDELIVDIKKYASPVFAVGDGALPCCHALRDAGVETALAPPPLMYQSAWGVAMAASDQTPAPAEELLPMYLRLSQAERERQKKIDRI